MSLGPRINVEHGTVLLVDDQDSYRRTMREALSQSGRFTRFFEANDGMEGFKILLNHLDEIDVVLCDLEMPMIDGFKFLGLKASKPELEEIPVILITTRDAIEHKVKGLELGASDYLTKPFDDAELIARSSVQLKVKRLQDQLRRHASRLEELSNTDPLTETYNRRYLESYIDNEYSRAVRYNHPLSIVMCDIDHFKSVNDTHGHQVGDGILIQIAQIFMYDLRSTDICARYGGEEFCLVLPNTDLEGAALVAERYRKQVEEREFRVGDQTLQVTVSFGISGYPQSAPRNVDELVGQADDALYHAKELGRNRVELFHRKN